MINTLQAERHVAEDFDIGPLSWVKDEIDQSLKRVMDGYIVVTEKPSEYASLRFTLAHLYQVSGALDMVGLEGCKRYCAEIEKLTGRIEKGQIPVTATLMEDLMLAVQTLQQYLQDLLNGMPDTPLRLFESLQHLASLQGETFEITDLFYPDTSFSPPKDLPSEPIDEAAFPVYVAEQRGIFQKSLLDWLMTKAPDALESMRNALFNVQRVQQRKSQKSLWWAASAFTEALRQENIAALAGAKKLCRKLDQQLRNLALGEVKVPNNLLRDVLYYVAISAPATAQIAKVKDVFALDQALPTEKMAAKPVTPIHDDVLVVLQHLLAELPSLKELWVGVSEFVTDQDFAKQTPVEELQGVTLKLELLLESLQSQKESQNPVHQTLVNLLGATHQVAEALLNEVHQLNEYAVLEVASALNFMESLAETYSQVDAAFLEKVNRQIERLAQLVAFKDGVMPTSTQAAEAETLQPVDDSVVKAVAGQIVSALREVEKSVDGFFRNASLTTGLDEAFRPLNQVVAAFDMLEMPTPKAIAKLALFYMEQFKANAPEYDTPHPNYDQFNVFAEALSLLSLYAQGLPDVRLESKYALSECLKRMEEGMQALDSVEEASNKTKEKLTENNVEQTAKQAAEFDLETINESASDLGTLEHVIPEPAFSDVEMEDRAIDAELQEIFVTEAEDVLESNVINLQVLRESDSNQLALTELRRAFHTLKGSGRTVGLEAMGEVAHAVEKLLNQVIEHKVHPSAEILDFADDANQAFTTWIKTLVDAQSVVLNPGKYQQRAAELTQALEGQLNTAKPKARKEEILIGGSRKVGRAFFYLFLGEAQGHLTTLQEAHKALMENAAELPSASSCRAAHTLSSNAFTAGFDMIGDLARALEHWLDEFIPPWSAKHLELYGKVVQALSEGLEKAKNLQNPKSNRALIIELSKSTAAMQVLAAEAAENAVESQKAKPKNRREVELSEQERLGNALSSAELLHTANRVPVEEASLATSRPAPLTTQLSVDDTSIVKKAPKSEAQIKAFDQELLGLFIEEAGELIPQIGRGLRAWKLEPQSDIFPDDIQRALHTLKGSARTAGQANIGDRVHELEDRVVNVLQRKPTLDDFDAMFIEFDRISFMLDDLIKSQAEEPEALDVPVTQPEVLAQIHAQQSNELEINAHIASAHEQLEPPTAGGQLTPTPTELTTQFLRVRAATLDKLINEAGEVAILRSRMDREMQGFKQSSTDLTLSVGRLKTYLQELEVEAESQLQSRMNVLQESTSTFDPLEMDRFTRLQELTRLMAESLSDITTIQQGLVAHIDQTDTALQQQSRMNRELQKGLMTVRMMPFSMISERLHRIVRQISRELGKHVELLIDGEDIELDRSVLDKVGAPLEHLLRNAVAHGLETPEVRQAAGKSPVGQIKLKVSVENDEISLTVSDDGRGVDLEKVKKTAIEKGLLKEDQVINEETLIAIIFESGFSTEDAVTKIAGRGVGLDAVRTDIAALNGRIDVSNVPGAGAKFNIYLPVTLSVTQVVMVRVDDQQFAIPAVMVEQVQTLKQQELMDAFAENKINWNAHEYPLHFLAKLVGQQNYAPKSQAYTPVALLRSGQYRAAIHVDEIIGNQEMVMKSMGTQLTRVPGIVGATVMGDGAIVFAINPVQLAHREALTVGAVRVTNFAPVEAVKKLALVVDDSLTMRKVLSRILEREGLEVVTANDGVDASQKLQNITPDIILTDIEMPRMDGFEFATQVRETPKFKTVPIIMISSRTAQKHQTIAGEIGVNAFLGKPVQDEELMRHVHDLLGKNSKKMMDQSQAAITN